MPRYHLASDGPNLDRSALERCNGRTREHLLGFDTQPHRRLRSLGTSRNLQPVIPRL
jgi:hypothetical protein